MALVRGGIYFMEPTLYEAHCKPGPDWRGLCRCTYSKAFLGTHFSSRMFQIISTKLEFEILLTGSGSWMKPQTPMFSGLSNHRLNLGSQALAAGSEATATSDTPGCCGYLGHESRLAQWLLAGEGWHLTASALVLRNTQIFSFRM